MILTVAHTMPGPIKFTQCTTYYARSHDTQSCNVLLNTMPGPMKLTLCTTYYARSQIHMYYIIYHKKLCVTPTHNCFVHVIAWFIWHVFCLKMSLCMCSSLVLILQRKTLLCCREQNASLPQYQYHTILKNTSINNNLLLTTGPSTCQGWLTVIQL